MFACTGLCCCGSSFPYFPSEPSLVRPSLASMPLLHLVRAESGSRVINCESPASPDSRHFRNILLILSAYCQFALIFVIQTLKMHLFLKIIREKFGQFGKKQYLCTRFRENGTKHRLKESRKQEFFDKIYINRK